MPDHDELLPSALRVTVGLDLQGYGVHRVKIWVEELGELDLGLP